MTDPSPFQVKGKLQVTNSATVVCVRRRVNANIESELDFSERFKQRYGHDKVSQQPFLSAYLSHQGFEFCSQWEVLLGQSEVINWLKSTREKLETMRYAGEFKLAGGNVDNDEDIELTAKRELCEEFLRPAETFVSYEDIILRPFSVKQTRPIRSKSNLMFNFVAIADENPWLSNLNIDEINKTLEFRRQVSCI